MKLVSILFFCFLIIAGIAIYSIPPYRNAVLQRLSYSACDTPLSYKLGSVDPKFGLSTDEVLQDINEATSIWSTQEKKNLFTYSSQAVLTVNFIYDERAALDTQINQLQSQVSQSQSSLEQQIADYKAQVSAFEQKLAAFNAEVAGYNAQGGAPKDVYDSLLKKQEQLNAQGNALNQEAKQLNLSTNNYNSNVSVLNGDIHQFQNELAQKPEEGLYSGANNTITIYFADNHSELIHTLSHEFGHALGMIHVQDPHAIMYPYTTSSLIVTPDDIQQLAFVCREQPLIMHILQEIDLQMIHLFQTVYGSFAKNQ